MRPLTVLIGIVMESAASITFGLVAVLIVFGILAGRHLDLLRKLPPRIVSLPAFRVLTAASASSFVGQAKERSWRGRAHARMLICLAVVVMPYLPRRS